MRGVSREVRQQTVDAFLEETGRDTFVPAEFLAWLEPKHNSPAWPLFFGKTDAELAHERRVDLVSSFVSGLRITLRSVEFVKRQSTENVKVVESDFMLLQAPAFFSPLSKRKTEDGGYTRFDPANDVHREEWAAEAARRLNEWMTRYQLAIVDAGLNLDGVAAMRDQLAVFADKTKRVAA